MFPVCHLEPFVPAQDRFACASGVVVSSRREDGGYDLFRFGETAIDVEEDEMYIRDSHGTHGCCGEILVR